MAQPLKHPQSVSASFAFLQVVLVEGFHFHRVQCVGIFEAFFLTTFQSVNSLLFWFIATE